VCNESHPNLSIFAGLNNTLMLNSVIIRHMRETIDLTDKNSRIGEDKDCDLSVLLFFEAYLFSF